MTTIAVTGGQGFIGKSVVASLVQGGKVDRVIIMDQFKSGDIEGAEEQIVDIHNKEMMVNALKEVDVVINLVAPYTTHGLAVADAAFESGTHFCDVCADVAITEALLAQDQKWKDAGLTVTTGLGMSPGLTNLCVSKNAVKLDEITDARMYWWCSSGEETDVEKIAGTARCFLKEEFGPVRSYEGGNRIDVIGFTDGAEEIEILGNKLTTYYAGHTEQVTVPLYFPGISNAILKGEVLPAGLSRLGQKAVAMGLNSEKILSIHGNDVTPLDFFITYMLDPDTQVDQYELGSMAIPEGFRVEVEGIRNGQKETISEGYVYGKQAGGDSLSLMTGVPAAVAAEYVATGEITRRGVFAPEAIESDLAAKLIDESLQRVTQLGGEEITAL
jgi:saccharopine dehydrogenase-like NADP-dependent oxidoreductase